MNQLFAILLTFPNTILSPYRTHCLTQMLRFSKHLRALIQINRERGRMRRENYTLRSKSKRIAKTADSQVQVVIGYATP